MNILLKNCSIVFFFLSLGISLKGQVFLFADTVSTNISGIDYDFLPVQSEVAFNFLFYSTKKEKQKFELLTLRDTSIISRIQIENPGLEGGGAWLKSAVMSDEQLLLLHVDGFLIVYKKDKKENFVLKETLNIGKQIGRDFNTISLLDSENVLLTSSYNYSTEKKLYDNYALCIYDLQRKEVVRQIEMDLGKGMLLSHFSTTIIIESKKNKIAVAHPTLPFIYIYNDKLIPIDTLSVQFQDTLSVDSVINAVFPDSFLELNRLYPKEIIQTIEDKKINQMERVEKVFWLTEDILGYIVRQPFSKARMFVFYSLSEKKELYKKIDPYIYSGTPMCTNFVSSKRILINNNKTIYYDYVYENDESDFYYQFFLYNSPLFNDAE
ncbi:MAG: hypothetical protein LBL13_05350 [Bacteroidales bacterium]|jgi:hypothetical protein|nr:hypothetical protein [Bacteroidales bacterium]